MPHTWLTCLTVLLTGTAAPAAPLVTATQAINLNTGWNVTGTKVVGFPLHCSTVSGTPTFSAGVTTVTDSSGGLLGLAPLLSVCSLTIESDEGAWGVITSIPSATTIEVDGDISDMLCGGEPYIIRKAKTILDVFGTSLAPGISATDPNAELVLVPGGGGLVTYWRQLPLGFWTTDGITNSSNDPIYHIQGIFVLRKGLPITLPLMSGDTKLTPTIVDTDSDLVSFTLFGGDWTSLSSLYITPTTLPLTGLTDDATGPPTHPWPLVEITLNTITQGTPLTGDIVWIQRPDGSFDRAYENNVTDTNFFDPKTPGVRQVGGPGNVPFAPLMSCGFVIQRQTGANYRIKFL